PSRSRLLLLLRDRAAGARARSGPRLRPGAAKAVSGPSHFPVARDFHPPAPPPAAVLHACAGAFRAASIPRRLRGLVSAPGAFSGSQLAAGAARFHRRRPCAGGDLVSFLRRSRLE